MSFDTESIVKLYSAVLRKRMEIESEVIESISAYLRNYGTVITNEELLRASRIFQGDLEVLSYLSSQLVRVYKNAKSVSFTDRDIELYVTLIEKYEKNREKFERRKPKL